MEALRDFLPAIVAGSFAGVPPWPTGLRVHRLSRSDICGLSNSTRTTAASRCSSGVGSVTTASTSRREASTALGRLRTRQRHGTRDQYRAERASNAAAARWTFAEVGLNDPITVLEGDARDTLADFGGSADFVLLDDWKDLCLPVLKLLEYRLAPGTLVVADNVDLDSLRLQLK